MRKNIIILFTLIIFMMQFVVAEDLLLFPYVGGYDGNYWVGESGTEHFQGQSFNLTYDATLEIVSNYIRQINVADGDGYVSIRTGSMSGTIIAYATNSSGDMHTGWFNWTLVSPVNLTAGTEYYIEWNWTGVNDRWYYMEWNNTEGEPSGSLWYWDSATWTAQPSQDNAFKIYGVNLTSSTNLTIRAQNRWNNTYLTGFNATLINGLNQYNFTAGDTTSTITTNLLNDGTSYNITITKTDYFDNTSTNHNSSSNYEGTIYQSIITPACYEKINTSNALTCVNGTIYPNVGVQNLTVEVANYYNVTQEQNITTLLNDTLNWTGFYSSNVSFETSFLVGDGSSNCDYYVEGVTYSSYTESYSTTTTNTSEGFINGTYTVTVDCDDYANSTLNFTVTSRAHTINFSLYTTNSINISFYDFNTDALLTENISIQFIGLTAQTNYTDTGTLYVDLFSPDEYTLLYQDVAENYRQGKYIITINNKTTQNLNLYLDLVNNTNLILLQVQNIFGDSLSDAQITIQRWDNDSWITDQIVQTDTQGLSEAYYILSNVFYNHIIEIGGVNYFGAINDDSNKKLIYAEDVTNGITFTINTLGGSQIINYQTINDVGVELTFVNTSNQSGYFRFAWDTPDNSQRTGCLDVYRGGDMVDVCTSDTTYCATSESGTILCTFNWTTTQVYTAVGTIDGTTVSTLIRRLEAASSTNINWGVTGYVFAFLLLVVSYFVFLSNPTTAVVFGGIVFTGLGIMGVIFSDMSYGMFMIFLVITYFVASIKSEQGVNA